MRYDPLVVAISGGLILLVCVAADPPLADRAAMESARERLEGMSDVDKAALLQKKRYFDELSPATQEQLRRIHAELSGDHDRDRLRDVLERYSEWLKTLSPVERAEVISLPAEQRIGKIRDLLRAQETERFHRMVGGGLDPADLKAIRQWLDDFVDAHADQILATLPPEWRARVPAADDDEPDRRRAFLRAVFLRGGGPNMPRPSAEDEQRLRASLSRDAVAVLNKAESDEDRSRLIQTWIRAADFSRMWAHVSVEELQQFAQESLDDRERDRLETLPRDQMYRELRWLYNQRRFGPSGDWSRRKFPSGGGRRAGGDRGSAPPPPAGPEFPSASPPDMGPGGQDPPRQPSPSADDGRPRTPQFRAPPPSL